MQYWVNRGITKFRIPFGWGQANPTLGTTGCQPTQFGDLDTTSFKYGYDALFNAVQSGTTLTVTSVQSGTIVVGLPIYTNSIFFGNILSQTSGTPGGVGVYLMSEAHTNTGFYGTTSGYMGKLDQVIANAVTAGAQCLLDLHAFGFCTPLGFSGNQLGGVGSPIECFPDVWGKLANRYKDNPGVYGLDIMNEPAGDMSSAIVFDMHQRGITAIRATGCTLPIYIEGTHYSGVWDWISATPNNNADLYQLVDPLNNLIISAHCYLDRESSGTHFSWANEVAAVGSSPPGISTNLDIFSQRAAAWIAWLSQHGLRGHIGEFGWSSDGPLYGGNYDWADWNEAARRAIQLCKDNNIEFSSWACGFVPGFDNYGYSPEPFDAATGASVDYTSAGVQAPQMVVYDHFTGYSGSQPTAYLLKAPTDYINPVTDGLGQVRYTPVKNLYADVGSPSEEFTIYYGGKITSSVTITPHAKLMDGTDAGGTFTPATVTLSAGDNALATFTYTPASEATIQISTTNNAGWTNPPSIGISSIASDIYRDISADVLSIIYPLYNEYTPNTGPAFQLQRASDSATADWGFNNLGNLDRAAIQAWASTRTGIKILKRYNTGPFAGQYDMTFAGPTYPVLNLDNADGYPEVVSVTGVKGTFFTPVSGKLSFSVITRFNQSSANNFFRIDEFNGPVYWSGTNVQIINTGWLGGTVVNPTAVLLSTTNLDITTGTYGEYALTYASNSATGVNTYKDGALTATTTTVGASFTGSAGTGNTLVATSVTGTIRLIDAVFGTGVPAGTYILSQASGTTGGAGTYNLSGPITSSGAALTSSYIINPAFGDGEVHFHWFAFGAQNWNGAEQTFRWFNSIELSDAQIAAFEAMDDDYYSTPLPDTLPPVNPFITGTDTNNCLVGDVCFPFGSVTVLDENTGGPTDTVTLTITGTAGGALSGTGLSGSNPYTLSADSAANITTKMRALTYTPSGTATQSDSIAILVSSSAGTSSNATSVRTLINPAAAETPFSAPVGTWTPIGNYCGVNLRGAEPVPPSPQFDHAYPLNMELDYLALKGLGLVRVPLHNRRIQPTSFGALDPPYPNTILGEQNAYEGFPAGTQWNLQAIKRILDHAFTKGIYVVLEPHNYGAIWDTFSGSAHDLIIGTDARGTAQQLDWWERVVTKFMNYPNVIWGIMNEPFVQTAAQWKTGCVAIIDAIAAIDTAHLVLIPGTNYTAAESFAAAGVNAIVWTGYVAPVGLPYAFEVHAYLDDNSGSHPWVTSGRGVACLTGATSWARSEGVNLFLGEMGWTTSTTVVSGGTGIPMTEGAAAFNHMSTNTDVYIGWSYWNGGIVRYEGAYMFGVVPTGYDPSLTTTGPGTGPFTDKPQMAILTANII